MKFSTPVGASNNTLTNSTQGDEELSTGEVVIQEQEGSKGDKVIDVIVMSKDELELRHEAKKVGFVTKVRNTNFDKMQKESKIPVNQFLHCTREGYRESRVKAATRTNRITATRCRVRMYVMLDREKECWVVYRLELRHSHPCLAKKAVRYHEYRELTMHAKCVITDNNEADIRPNKTYLVLSNEEINPSFFYTIDVDDANKFKSALWVDTRHGLPFASFVSVNHHEKSTLFGCALLGSEEIPNFEWVFTQWVRCIRTTLRGLITDQCKAMTGAIRKVLSDIVHRCALEAVIMFCLSDTLMFFFLGRPYANRWKWVPIFFKSEFWASMRSTQWSESMHAFYGGFLHCKSRLVQFVHEYDNVLGNKEQKELEDDAADSKGVIPCIGSTAIERQFYQEYTSNMFNHTGSTITT
ncbi:protein FAR-RED IMPAIRED RESPONSE 1-like [Arachis duranensis]|uniref:Protein FAR1-RELATED SEQUENCE n=1 Tax=Arachis duranensis TaxID=130453 RepID=A0A6P4B462_ARADU|nr:protein FAR-RED IMPAIRED RESPONSE 1-like [Arachis duranensis]